jgi:hypothetical protein
LNKQSQELHTLLNLFLGCFPSGNRSVVEPFEVQVATLFQNVVRANHPPSNVVKTVKKAVKHVKDHAETWDSRPFG